MEQLISDEQLEALYIKYSDFCINLPKICVFRLQFAMAKTTEPDEKEDKTVACSTM